MNNKEKKIVRLLEEGFSYETIKKMNDYHLNKIYKNLVNEAVVSVSADKFEDIKDKLGPDDKVEVTEETPLDKDAEQIYTGQEGPHDEKDMAPDGMDDDSDNNRKEMGEEFDEDAVVEELFGKPKMKTPITTLGMFEGEVEEIKESKIRQIEESIVSLIKKSQGKMITKGDLLSEEPSTAPTRVKPGTKERPSRTTPYRRPNPGPAPKPKASDTETAPTRVKPGTKERPSRTTPYRRPNPGPSPKPKAGDESGLPEFLKFSNLNIQFRDE